MEDPETSVRDAQRAVEAQRTLEEQRILDLQMRALAHLRALERVLGEASGHASSDHLETYTTALDHLAKLGEDVEEFRFHGTVSQLPKPIGPVINRDLLRANVGAVLEYFTIRQAVMDLAEQMKQEPARMIGFAPPQR